jgi:hypothetical protein
MERDLFAVLVPNALRALDAADQMLEGVLAFSQANEQPPRVLLERRLIPDMFPFHRQIEIVTTGIVGALARLSLSIDPDYCGYELSVFNRGAEHEFDSGSLELEALRTSVQAARNYTLSPHERRRVDPGMPIRVCKPGEQRSFRSADTFVFDYVLPNLYFHVSIAYAILRSAGVPLGKGDYMGRDVYEVEHAPAHDLPSIARSQP